MREGLREIAQGESACCTDVRCALKFPEPGRSWMSRHASATPGFLLHGVWGGGVRDRILRSSGAGWPAGFSGKQKTLSESKCRVRTDTQGHLLTQCVLRHTHVCTHTHRIHTWKCSRNTLHISYTYILKINNGWKRAIGKSWISHWITGTSVQSRVQIQGCVFKQQQTSASVWIVPCSEPNWESRWPVNFAQLSEIPGKQSYQWEL